MNLDLLVLIAGAFMLATLGLWYNRFNNRKRKKTILIVLKKYVSLGSPGSRPGLFASGIINGSGGLLRPDTIRSYLVEMQVEGLLVVEDERERFPPGLDPLDSLACRLTEKGHRWGKIYLARADARM